ncbi:MAG: beta-glucosidase, partial [Gemmatimonadetes bacterium]|nr:beta-glucosidase [Gemmatimonadota bacterium]NIQ57060.1 beta-glucosidase [Gemmatimonadota bacterium]NIU77234.1 beta-glucosidase [Gammaproteobacteria bacterium]NIX22942.1 beta-glucosidase [Actinomycetota bacterium]NIX46517.1 beta-glucosidase [Gemmatimonadota bacterium]
IEQPAFGLRSGYSQEDVAAGGNGYVPISLQYGEYTAEHARDPSIAGGDPLEDFTNRTFRGKTVTTSNATDLEMVLEAREVMG